MILDKIEALRKEPKTKRNRVAFVLALSTTLVIMLVWTISLPSRLDPILNPPETKKEDKTVPTAAERFSVVRNYLDESLTTVQSQAELIESAGQSTTTSATTTPTTTVMTATSTATSSIIDQFRATSDSFRPQ